MEVISEVIVRKVSAPFSVFYNTAPGRVVVLSLVNIYLKVYYLWLLLSTWFLNWVLFFILIWWFRLRDVTITINEFGFCVIRGVKIKWKDDPVVTIDEVTFQIEWEFTNIRNITIVFHVNNVRQQLFSGLKDATCECYTSFILHWKLQSPGDLISSDIRNSSETIPKTFHLHYATDVEIGTKLHLQTGQTFITLIEVTSVSALLIPTEQATTLVTKAMGITYSCGPYDVNLIQAKQQKTMTMSVMDFESTWPTDGPAQTTISSQDMEISINPSKANYALLFLNHLWIQVLLNFEGTIQSSVIKGCSNEIKSIEVSVKAANCKASVCLLNGEEVVNVPLSLELNSQMRNKKLQFTASVDAKAIVPSPLQAADPCAIVGNEMISAPWKCTLSGSHVTGNCTVARVFSEQEVCVVLRPECVTAFNTLYQEYSCSLDRSELTDLFTSFSRETQPQQQQQQQQDVQKQILLDFKGARLCLEMDLFEELLNVTVEDIKGEFSRDQHHTTCDFSIKDFEVEDCVTEVIAVQQPPSDGQTPRPVLSFSLLQDEAVEDSRIVVKKLYARLGDLSVSVEEQLLLKLLQFGGVKDKAQLWGEETSEDQENPSDNYPALLTATSCFFERIEVEPFQVMMTSSPAKNLSDEQQCLKDTLAIPAGFPPVMEKASIQFGEFLRTRISYRTMLAFGRDVRRHYLKEVGRHSTSLLGSLHLFGNLSSLHGDIADGLADLRETGDYVEFVKQVRGGLAESYFKFADSWSGLVKKSATKAESTPPSSSCSTPVNGSPKISVRGVVGSLTSFIFSPSPDSSQGKLQLSGERPQPSPPDSPSRFLNPRRLVLTDSDHESSGSEESSLSCIKSEEEWDLVPRDVQRTLKGQEFLHRLQVSLYGQTNEEEKFVSCLKLRYRNHENKLNALVTSRKAYFMKVGSPSADHVVLMIKLVDLYKARHKAQDKEHFLELLMRVSGGRRLSLPSPNPADSPLVRCDTAKIAQKTARIINESKKKSEETGS